MTLQCSRPVNSDASKSAEHSGSVSHKTGCTKDLQSQHRFSPHIHFQPLAYSRVHADKGFRALHFIEAADSIRGLRSGWKTSRCDGILDPSTRTAYCDPLSEAYIDLQA